MDDKIVKAFLLHIHQVISSIYVASKSTKTFRSEVPTLQDPGELLVYHTLHYRNC